MEWCDGGDLRKAIDLGAFCSERRLRDGVVRPMLHVLSALAAQSVVHRDIKPENVFVSSSGGVRLGDFGLAISLGGIDGCGWPLQGRVGANNAGAIAIAARRAGAPADADGVDSSSCGIGGSGSADDSEDPDEGGPGSLGSDSAASAAGGGVGRGGLAAAAGGLGKGGRSASFRSLAALDVAAPQQHAAGTAAYTAPEVLMAALTSSPVQAATQPKNDVFALGIIALECLTRRHPFVSPDATSGSIVCSVLSSRPVPLPRRCAAAACGSPVAAAQAGAADGDAAGAELSAECLDWLGKALEKDPSRRLGADELLAHPWMALQLPQGGARSSCSCEEEDASWVQCSGGAAAGPGPGVAGCSGGESQWRWDALEQQQQQQQPECAAGNRQDWTLFGGSAAGGARHASPPPAALCKLPEPSAEAGFGASALLRCAQAAREGGRWDARPAQQHHSLTQSGSPGPRWEQLLMLQTRPSADCWEY